MKTISLIFLSIVAMISGAKSQDISGKWYGIGESYLAELIITKDSLKMQMLGPKQSSKGFERKNIKHFGIYDAGDKKLIVVADKSNKEERQYLAMTFFHVRKHQSIELAANAQTKPAKTINTLIDAIGKDNTGLFGNVFYSAEKIQEFKMLKDVETMSVEDFRSYLKKFVEKRESKSFMEERMPGTFHDQIVNETLLESGYNPLFRADWENRFFEKYLSDKEVGKIHREHF